MLRRGSRNAILPIAKLHHDILSEIFTILAIDGMYRSPTSEPPYRWIRVTHVCRSWREIALSSPRVWSYVRFTSSLHCMREILSRSKQAPLHLDFVHSNFDYGTPLLDLLFAHMHRAISISLSIYLLLARDSTKLPRALPWVTEFSLLKLEWYEDGARAEDAFNPCDMPRLSCLTVNGHYMTWTHPIFKQGSLTQLKVFRSAPPSNTVFKDLLEVLRGTPSLEQLTLDHTLGPSVSGSQTVDVVLLTRLRLLSLTDHPSSCAQLLHHLSLPPTVSIHIDIDSVVTDAPCAAALGKAIASKIDVCGDLEVEDRLCIRSFALNHSASETCIQGFSDDLGIALLRNGSHVSTRAKPWVEVVLHGDTRLVIGCALCATLPFSTVQTLYVETSTDRLPVTDLSAMAKGMADVHTFGIDYRNYDRSITIPELLSEQTSASHSSSAEQLLFPHLVNLELSNIKFCFDPDCPEDDEVVSGFHEMLALRADAGAKVQKLHLHSSVNMFRRDVEKLKEVVGEVIWDPQDVRFVVPGSWSPGVNPKRATHEYMTQFIDPDFGLYNYNPFPEHELLFYDQLDEPDSFMDSFD